MNRLYKRNRLKSKKIIAQLFAEGKTWNMNFFLTKYQFVAPNPIGSSPGHQVLFSVPKKK